MRPSGSFTVDAADPCFDGHFPGNPLVPGVVLLDRAFACIGTMQPASLGPARLETVKFTAPVLPGAVVDVAYHAADGRIRFACAVQGAPVLNGTLLTDIGRLIDADASP